MRRHKRGEQDTLLAALSAAITPPKWKELRKVWSASPTNENWWAMYTAYLNSDEWDEKRAKVLARDHHRCRLCSAVSNLQVHHPPIAYRHIGDENIDDLTTLCEPCHTVVTMALRVRAKNGNVRR